MVETKIVPFMDAQLIAIKDSNGQVCASARHICRGIGLTKAQTNSQMEKIKEDIVLSKGYGNFRTPTNGGEQESLCLKLDYIPLWLAKINVTPSMRQVTPSKKFSKEKLP